MDFFFCEACGKRVTEHDVSSGDARNKKLKGVYCRRCADGVSTMEELPLTHEEARELLQKEPPPAGMKPEKAPARGRSTGANRPYRRRHSESAAGPDMHAGVPDRRGWLLGILATGGLIGFAAVVWIFLPTDQRHSDKAGKVSTASVDTRHDAPPDRKNDVEPQPGDVPKSPDRDDVNEVGDAEAAARTAFDALGLKEAAGDQSLEADIRRLEAFLEKHPGTTAASRGAEMLEHMRGRLASLVREPPETNPVENQSDPRKGESAHVEGISKKVKMPVVDDKATEALAEKSLRTLLDDVLQDLSGREPAAALSAVREALNDPRLKTLHSTLRELEAAAVAVEKRQKAEAQAWKKLADGKERVIATEKGPVRGVVRRVEADALRVLVEGRIDKKTIQYERVVKIADMPPQGRSRLLGLSEPSGDAEWLAVALEALGASRFDQADKALESAGDSLLVQRLIKRLAHARAAASEIAAEAAWRKLRGKIAAHPTEADARQLTRALDAFAKAYKGTAFLKKIQPQFNNARRLVGNLAQGVPGQIRLLFRGRVESLDLETLKLTVVYDFNDVRQKADFLKVADMLWMPGKAGARLKSKFINPAMYGNRFDPKDLSITLKYRGATEGGFPFISMGWPEQRQRGKGNLAVFCFSGKHYLDSYAEIKNHSGRSTEKPPKTATLRLLSQNGFSQAYLNGRPVGGKYRLRLGLREGYCIGGARDFGCFVESLTLSGKLNESWLRPALEKLRAKKK